MKDLLNRITSRKFFLAIVGIVLILSGEKTGLTSDQLNLLVLTIIGYIAGESYVDANKY